MTTADHARVRALLGREPRGRFEVVVRDEAGDPVVLRNAPLLDDGTPMPTRYWLVSPTENQRIGRLEADGGVDASEADVDAQQLADAHARYAAERDAAIPADHTGPRPSGGVGGTRVGVKCLHAHWAWHLAGGDDPIGRWIETRLRDAEPPPRSGHESDVVVQVADHLTITGPSAEPQDIPWGPEALADRWLRDHDPPRADALTNALGTIADHLDDVVRATPDVAEAPTWRFHGDTVTSLANLEAGVELPAGDIEYPRPTAEEVFRLVATEPLADRRQNPGLPPEHADVIVATCVIVQAVMRYFHLDAVTLVVPDDR